MFSFGNKDKQAKDADQYIATGKLDKALKIYTRLLGKDPNDTRLLLKLGDIYSRKRDIPRSIETYLKVAEAYVREKFHLKAIAVYKVILKLNPTFVAINEKLGDLYLEVGGKKDAASQYLIVSDYYEQTGDHKKVTEIREKIVAIDPSSTTSRIRLAEAYQKGGKIDESLRQYREAAEALYKKNNREGMIEVFEKILFYQPDQPRMLANLCRIYLERGDPQKALQRLEAASDKIKQTRDVMEVAVDVYLKLERRENARKALKELYEIAIRERDIIRADKVYRKVREEFADDEEYLKEIDEMRKGANLQEAGRADLAGPALDLEKTAMVNIGEPAPQEKPDLEKTMMIDLAAYERSLKEKGSS